MQNENQLHHCCILCYPLFDPVKISGQIKSHAYTLSHIKVGARVSVVVETLRYKPEGKGIDTRWSNGGLSIYLTSPAKVGPETYSETNRSKRKQTFLGSRERQMLEADNLTVIYEPIV
jgi:hypothetical protein